MVKIKTTAARLDMFEEKVNSTLRNLQEKNCHIISVQCVEIGALTMTAFITFDDDDETDQQNKPA